MTTIVSVFGTRPQIIKLAPIARALAKSNRVKHIIINTGQHFDAEMDANLLSELQLPAPDINLGVGSASQAKQTAAMLIGLEDTLLKYAPKVCLVFGDTNSTLAAALAATKLHIPLAHVESGLRSFNRAMPEEINRIVTDSISDILFVPVESARQQLLKENVAGKVVYSGDVMYDNILQLQAQMQSNPRQWLPANIPNQYYLATVHRPVNTDNPERLRYLLNTFTQLDLPVVLPLHPRTRIAIAKYGLSTNGITVLPPQSYRTTQALIYNSQRVLTDSGGVQKEAWMWNKPCITLRDETEWTNTLEHQWNVITGADHNKILAALNTNPSGPRGTYFGNGQAAQIIATSLEEL